MLLPVWRADVQATIFDSEPYDLIDRFLEAAIVKGGLQTEAGVVGYLAYTQASQEADPEWSQVCSVAEEVAALVENEYQSGRDEGEEKAARRWAEKRSPGGQYDIGWRSGLLVATFPASAFTCGGTVAPSTVWATSCSRSSVTSSRPQPGALIQMPRWSGSRSASCPTPCRHGRPLPARGMPA
jgi:hypothetical protein